MRSIVHKTLTTISLLFIAGSTPLFAQQTSPIKITPFPDQSLPMVVNGGKIQNFGYTSELHLDLQVKDSEAFNRAIIAVYVFENGRLVGGEGIPIVLSGQSRFSSHLIYPHFPVNENSKVLVLVESVQSAQKSYSENAEKVIDYLKGLANGRY